MESAVTAEEKGTASNLLPVEEMRKLTTTPEEIRKRRKGQVLDSIFSSMVRVATESGHEGYGADFNAQTEESFITEIEQEIKKLGYTTKIEALKHPATNTEVKRLNISWKQDAVS